MFSLIKVTLLFFLFVIELHSQDVEKFRSRIDNFLAGTNLLEKTIVAIDVYDLSSLESLYSLNNKLLLLPASNMKLLTSAAGIIFLEDYNYRTSLMYTGEIINGQLLGDLYIIGGCDPTFSTGDLDTLINHLKLLNINRITGNIYGDLSFKDNLYWGNGWMWDDEPSPDAPYLSALNINGNSVNVILDPLNTEKPLRTDPESSYFILNNLTTLSNNPETLFITRDWQNRNNIVYAAGNVNTSDQKERVKKINVYDPALYFLHMFGERLEQNFIIHEGIKDIRITPAFAKEVYTKFTPFDFTLFNINKSSINLDAEMTLFALAEKLSGRPASAINGLQFVDSLLKLSGNITGDYKIVDGSGVSRYNLLSADLLLSVLKYMYFHQPDNYSRFYNSLSIAGKDGTLRNRMKGTYAEGKIYGKTGTLAGVSCLSGYADSLSGRKIAFSIMIQNFTGMPGYARYIQDELCRIITEY